MNVNVGSFRRPAWGNTTCGDAVVTVTRDNLHVGAIIDGLGHGDCAAEASMLARDAIEASAENELDALIRIVDLALRGSRGAAAGIFRFETRSARLSYIGVGNTVARLWKPDEERFVSREGILGGGMHQPLVQSQVLQNEALLVLYTDGVGSHFRAEEYPGLLRDAPAIVARTVVKRFGKQHDDAACLVARIVQ